MTEYRLKNVVGGNDCVANDYLVALPDKRKTSNVEATAIVCILITGAQRMTVLSQFVITR